MKTELPFDPTATVTRHHSRACWMVVDDNDAVLNLVVSLLEALGVADVHRYRTAAEALAAFLAAPDRFQFVVTDLDMPGMNGIELCRRLHQVSPRLKVVLATGSSVVNEPGARQCGFCGLLAKPFPAAALWRIAESAGVLPSATANSSGGDLYWMVKRGQNLS